MTRQIYYQDRMCPVCRKTFMVDIQSGRVYCSAECRRASKTYNLADYIRGNVERGNASWARINSVAEEASKRGLSYGQEMARRRENGE